jgi:hypothetical protein
MQDRAVKTQNSTGLKIFWLTHEDNAEQQTEPHNSQQVDVTR